MLIVSCLCSMGRNAITLDEQIDLLRSRGMIIEETAAKKLIRRKFCYLKEKKNLYVIK